MAEEPNPPAADQQQHDVDGCVCDIELTAAEITSDADLPPAAGGVQTLAGEGADDEADGCDLDFSEAEPTSDEDLPVATGGVA